ncbi:exonuclease SbcC [Catalinimonas alkaloidigena]|uniref:Exonuclease SbcC n=1 Tax=Catalinimonas alkaloidigena TaxID=1075417 RepID=A0A1G9EME0_9BACT|nr:SMC family ATPase [Catalinimonas alkaloidigena]SDK77300.1 exonuclease SbcC [Catalinimonas alkaloidigena]
MIPELLTLQGLYSYKEPQTIDFATLTSSRLFGIFGAVGSGKSSILEAIMFVLYDRSDRLNKSGDDRYYNMMNLQSDEMSIDFTFRCGPQNQQKYRFLFKAKRKKKRFDQVSVDARRFLRWCDEKADWDPMIGVSDAERIIGMSYENFMQTIIIPQGKFREFIDQKPNDRSKMLKQLFHLEKFDLFQKTNVLTSRTKHVISNLEGQLAGIGVVDEDDIANRQHRIEELKISIRAGEAEVKNLELRKAQLDELRKLFREIREAEAQWAMLCEQKQHYHAQEQRMLRYERARTYFGDKLERRVQRQQEIDAKETRLTQLKQQADENQTALQTAAHQLQEAKAAYETRDRLKEQADDLRHLIRLKNLRAEQDSLAEQAETEQARAQQVETKLKLHRRQLTEREQQLAEQETNQPDTAELTQVQNWLQQRDKQHRALEEAKAEQERLCTQKKAVTQRLQERLNQTKAFAGLTDFAPFYERVSEEEQKIHARLQQLRHELQQALIRQTLARYADDLREGESCPLCGATHHPAVTVRHTADQDVAEAEARVKKFEEGEQRLHQLREEVRLLDTEASRIDAQLETQQGVLQRAQQQVETHQQQFVWSDYAGATLDAVEQQLKAARQHQAELHNSRQALKQLREDVQTQEEVNQKAQLALNEFEKKRVATRTQVEAYSNLLKHFEEAQFERFSVERLEANLEKGQARIAEIEQNYEKADAAQRQHEQQRSLLEGQLSTETLALQHLRVQETQATEELTRLCAVHEFQDLPEVEALLRESLDIAQERKEIQDFYRLLDTTEYNLSLLRERASGQQWDEAEYLHHCGALDSAKKELDEDKREIALQNKALDELIVRRQNRQSVEKMLEVQQHRLDNLKELAGLFRGSGFVDYVSSIYLQNLCEAANERFTRLTRNHFSLELSDTNEFVVRDHLNDGKTRLLKTLSGGQTFQAALCLALALAENVKALNQAEQSFFFLDEGFGALDKDSLRLVFETLKALQKENRIVGIISHVEELQQEIGVYLRIENHREHGSQVSYSWE